MDDDFYKSVFDKAIKELSTLLNERMMLSERMAEVNQRISKVREGALGLIALGNQDPKQAIKQYPELSPDLIDPDLGLTDAVRRVMKTNSDWITPRQVRDGLVVMGFDLGKYTNPLASIHTTLKRLVESGEMYNRLHEVSGKSYYRLSEFQDEEEARELALKKGGRAAAKHLRGAKWMSDLHRAAAEEELPIKVKKK